MTGWCNQDLWYHSLAIGRVSGLYRHAVKGLSADSLEQVQLETAGSFPDDRRFALIKQESASKFDARDPIWIHKENFLCAFTDPHLMARYRASYSTIPTIHQSDSEGILTLWERSSNKQVLGPLDLSTEEGRQALADFFSRQAGIPLVCVTAENHQFGNTGAGWKQKGDTRTIHIVHESTVRALQEAIGKSDLTLNPTRFRPNIVLRGDALPFSEFDWVGKSLQCGSSLRLQVISKSVRCQGINVDPLDLHATADIPELLTRHFPNHGPYLGVYACVESGGVLSMGDELSLL